MTHERLPVDDPAYWRDRLEKAQSTGEIHKAVYDIDEVTWEHIRRASRQILADILGSGEGIRLLDCGCGYGDLIDSLPPRITYTGVDISPDLISLARTRYPHHNFLVGDLRSLPFPSRSFDVATCRAIEGMTTANLGAAVWRQMEAEILRVADRLIIISYTTPDVCHITDAVSNPEEYTCNTIRMRGGQLVYRPGKDGTCEIYDLLVDEDKRRQGIGSALIHRLCLGPYSVLYGFTRVTNGTAQRFYEAQGFRLSPVPGLYRGMDGVMFTMRVPMELQEERRLL